MARQQRTVPLPRCGRGALLPVRIDLHGWHPLSLGVRLAMDCHDCRRWVLLGRYGIDNVLHGNRITYVVALTIDWMMGVSKPITTMWVLDSERSSYAGCRDRAIIQFVAACHADVRRGSTERGLVSSSRARFLTITTMWGARLGEIKLRRLSESACDIVVPAAEGEAAGFKIVLTSVFAYDPLKSIN
jgi:hypothetical protein